MRKSVLTLEHLYIFIKCYFQRIENIEPVRKRGKPKTFEDALILTLWLYHKTKLEDEDKELVKEVEF